MANTPVRQYIGARYVPLFADPAEWENTKTYEPLTIVLHEGNSYTSRQYVPIGIDINNTEFWALTGNYNAQIESYRQEVQQLKKQTDDNTNNIDKIKETIYLYVNDYGAKGDGTTDDTAAIQTAINTAITNNARKIIFNGTYKISKQAVDTESLPYAILINNLTNCEIDFNNSKFIQDITNYSNIFHITNSENIKIHNGNCEYINTDTATPETQLYTGAFIDIYECENIQTSEIYAKNTLYGIEARNSNNITIENTIYTNNLTTITGYSGILIHTTNKAKVNNNTIIGNLIDGALSIYGSGTYDCIVTNNIVESHNKPTEGITIDAGAHNNTIANNYISKFNYGIDIKALAQENIIESNNVANCVIGIANRPGEETNDTASNPITNNIITFGSPIQSDYKPAGYNQIGILSSNRNDTTINENTLTLENHYDNTLNICGIYISQTETGTQGGQNRIITVNDNTINFNILISGTWNYINSTSYPIHIQDGKYITINNNTINIPNTNTLNTYPININGTNDIIKITNNTIKMYTNKDIINYNNSTINTLILNNNTNTQTLKATYYTQYEKTQKTINYRINPQTGDTNLLTINTAENALLEITGISIYGKLYHINTTQAIRLTDMTEITNNTSEEITLKYENNNLILTTTANINTLKLTIKITHEQNATITLPTI